MLWGASGVLVNICHVGLCGELEDPFVAHLFLKALWRMRIERSVVIDALLKNLPAEITIKDQHP